MSRYATMLSENVLPNGDNLDPSPVSVLALEDINRDTFLLADEGPRRRGTLLAVWDFLVGHRYTTITRKLGG
jgi:hypothetical protein